MPSYHEQIFHDRQLLVDQDTHTTSSNVFVDIPGAEITTVDLSQPARYTILFSVLVSPSVANSLAEFQLLVDGVPLGGIRELPLKGNGIDIGFPFFGEAEISGSCVLTAQWRTDKGTLTMSDYNALIDGIPTGRILT